MGSGSYDYEARSARASASGYATTHASDATVFRQAASRTINQGMDPALIVLRECRDNPDHPATFPVVLALDVTGSMGSIPVELVKHDLPRLMQSLLAIHPDIALCFMAVGDHECDRAPLQIGQFEASDELLDHWLTSTWIESGGGGNAGESYALPWLFAINGIATDAWDKRQQKGLIITIGDEPILPTYYKHQVHKVFGKQLDAIAAGMQIFEKEAIHDAASERWDIHHIAMRPLDQSWNFMSGRFHQIPRSPSVVDTVTNIVRLHLGTQGPAAPGEVLIDVTTHDSPNPPQTIPTPL